MKKIIVPYLLLLLVVVISAGLFIFYKGLYLKSSSLEIPTYCSLFGALGGLIYCLRGYYLHSALLKNWDPDWNAWYYIRPIVSGVMGFISLIFIKAGLLIFSADTEISVEGNKTLAYFAVAFIAGYNVQNFLIKLEDIFNVILGIEKKTPPRKEKEE